MKDDGTRRWQDLESNRDVSALSCNNRRIRSGPSARRVAVRHLTHPVRLVPLISMPTTLDARSAILSLRAHPGPKRERVGPRSGTTARKRG